MPEPSAGGWSGLRLLPILSPLIRCCFSLPRCSLLRPLVVFFFSFFFVLRFSVVWYLPPKKDASDKFGKKLPGIWEEYARFEAQEGDVKRTNAVRWRAQQQQKQPKQ